jgi:hypothetical protein
MDKTIGETKSKTVTIGENRHLYQLINRLVERLLSAKSGRSDYAHQ